jgi:ankyrin repeat protein
MVQGSTFVKDQLRAKDLHAEKEETRDVQREIGKLDGTELMLACEACDFQMIEKCLVSGVDINYCDSRGATPLMEAALYGHADLVEFLISKGADLEKKDRLLGLNALLIASFLGHYDVAKVLLDSGSAIDVRDKKGRTPLHEAVYAGHEEIVKLLLQNGANPNLLDKNGNTPLMAAAGSEEKEILKEIIRHIAFMLPERITEKSHKQSSPLDKPAHANFSLHDNTEEAFLISA